MPFQSEEDLRQSFLRHAPRWLWSGSTPGVRVMTVLESNCSEGRADWVWARVACDWPNGVAPEVAALLQQPTCSRILETLKPQAARRECYLQARVGVARRTFRRWLAELLRAGLVSSPREDRYVLGPRFSLPEIEICSFEFKLENWKRAFYQAKRYRTFSHRVFVVMPPRAGARVNGSLEHFRTFNIGLITHDADGTSQRVLPSRRREPVSRAGLIRALGMLLDQGDVIPAIR
jgi:DNA-binding transcriptional ArsR family regulator